MSLRRLILIRHGESTGNSSERLIGSGDPGLSEEGVTQIRAAGRSLAAQVIDYVVASPLRRAWKAAQLLAPSQWVRLDTDLREIHFGRWEGKSLKEIESADPALYGQWRDLATGFEFPGGELRADFRSRIARGVARIEDAGASSALVVTHKGVIRAIVEELTSEHLDRDAPALGGVVVLTRLSSGWIVGQRSSDPS